MNRAHFYEKCQSVLLKSKEAEEMVLATFGEGNKVSKAICIDRFAFQYLGKNNRQSSKK